MVAVLQGLAGTAPLVAAVGPPRPAPDALSVFTTWTIAPAPVAVALVAVTGYAVALRRLRGRREPWSPLRTTSFGAGVLAMLVVSCGWVGAYSHTLFWAYALQLICLLVPVPLLLALGAPLSLSAAAWPDRFGGPLRRVLNGRAARVLTYPGLGTVLLAAVPFALYFTGWYELTLRQPVQYGLLQALVVGVGFVFSWPLGETDLVPHGFSYPVALFLAFIELLVDALPGIAIRLAHPLFAVAYYRELARPWGGGLRADQKLGGGVWWILGESLDIPFLALLIVRWVRADAREAEETDRRLDALHPPAGAHAAVSASPGPSSGRGPGPGTGRVGGPDDGAEDGRTAPWWLTDPSVFGSRAERYGWTGPRDDEER